MLLIVQFVIKRFFLLGEGDLCARHNISRGPRRGKEKSPVEKLLLFTQKQNKTRRTDEREKKFREKPKLKF